ncbi:MAG: hypothetical protein WA858_11080, partial [Xanthobacteraceae bacterium]
HNSAFGTAYAIVDGNPLPVCDYAGFEPFGFGYRRCPAEQLTIKVFEDFLRKVWNSKIELKKLVRCSPNSGHFFAPHQPTQQAMSRHAGLASNNKLEFYDRDMNRMSIRPESRPRVKCAGTIRQKMCD